VAELHIFLISQDWKCPARIYRKQSCDNHTIFSYAIHALPPMWLKFVLYQMCYSAYKHIEAHLLQLVLCTVVADNEHVYSPQWADIKGWKSQI